MRTNSFTILAEEAFRQFVTRPEFPCLGAKAALNSNSETVRVFEELGSADSTRALGESLRNFSRSTLRTAEYSTFVAIFQRPRQVDEEEFENRLWKQLRLLREQDTAEHDPDVSSDPSDPHFSFSFGGQALYVIGMHANSSREARRFPWPTLVFNPHEQFERLRADGKWKRMQETIRERDVQLQGTINPMLSDFGDRSEARQYSGRAVGENWRAPFPAANPGKCPFAH